jgi:hypothetical protein
VCFPSLAIQEAGTSDSEAGGSKRPLLEIPARATPSAGPLTCAASSSFCLAATASAAAAFSSAAATIALVSRSLVASRLERSSSDSAWLAACGAAVQHQEQIGWEWGWAARRRPMRAERQLALFETGVRCKAG